MLRNISMKVMVKVMAKSVSLPFKKPMFATVQNSGAAEFAMIGHPTAFNSILNQITNITCTRRFIKGFTTPEVNIPNVNIHNYKFIGRYYVGFRFTYDYCMDIIKAMLDSGMYIYYGGVDDFYLPGKSWYGTRHMHHDGIICGYDDNDGTISIAAHDINWVYNLIRMPQECFMRGLKSSLEAKYYGLMTGYIIEGEVHVEIQEDMILNNLNEYMDSNFEKYPIDAEGEVKGIVVHDYLAMYIDKLKDGSIPYEKMDWRALRPVWEHKKCMLERIKAVEKKNGWGTELSERYALVVEKADRVRMMYAMYHKNHNEKLLDKIRNGLLDLGKSDKELVGIFIEKLEKLAI